MPKIVVAQGLEQQQPLLLTKSVVLVGRSEQCDIVLPNSMVSRRHAAIVEQDGGYFLDDLQSRNGTRLNGQPVSARTRLRDGDLIQVDEVVLRFCEFDETPHETWSAECDRPDEQQAPTDHIFATLDVDIDRRLQENAENKLRAIVELSRNIGVSLDIDAVLPRVLESLLQIFPRADRASVVLSEDGRSIVPYAVKARSGDGGELATIGPISRTVIRRVLTEGIAILSSDVLADGRFEKSPSVLELGIRSMICAPLIGPSRQPVGVLTAEMQQLAEPFEASDLDVLVTVARLTAQNMDYVRLHQQSIEEREQREEVLRKANETLRALINSSPLALFLVNRSGQVDHVWNPAAKAMFGWEPDEVFQRKLQIVASEDRQRFEQCWARVWRGESFTGEELRCFAKGGRTVDVQLSGAPLRSKDQNVSGVLFIAADITELKKTRAELMQKERLAAIGETVTGLSHESRNAIARIQLGLELLERMDARQAEMGEVLGHMRDACDDLQYLYEDVRQFGAPVRLEKVPTDICALSQRTWDELAGTRSGRDAKLYVHALMADSSVDADPARLQQVFRNLFENSLSACRDPVRIEVTISPTADTSGIQVSVRDNGPGLNSDQKRQVFEPFYTTKTNGTGLGMAIVRRIIEAHGGTITVGQGDRAGAEFIIDLPRDPAH